jgi:general L-amino acid transport system permease protein
VRQLFFSSWASTLTTVLLALVCAWLGWVLYAWGVRDAVFSTAGAPQTCRTVQAGACWAVIGEKLRLILFGTYPYAQQWRPAVALLLLIAMYALSVQPRMWNWRLAVGWLLALGAFRVLMLGGVLGLAQVSEDQWGGLPVTLILATLGLVIGFALAVPMALVRHAPGGGVVKALVIAYIELVRAVPLLAVLFLASVMIPLFLPGMDVSKLLRVIVAFAFVTAAYLAEVVRGGLRAVPRGQREASAALGLSGFVTTTRIVLPQALTHVLPALVNVFIAFFKATSIVVVVGIFDLMSAAKRATADAQWEAYGTEIFLFVAFIYFAFCSAISWYSARLQAERDRGRRR